MEQFRRTAVALLCVLSLFSADGDNGIVVTRQGTKTILPCGAQEHLNEVESISWSRTSQSTNIVVFTKFGDGDPVVPRPDKYNVSDSYQLEILNVSASDAGSYRCDYLISVSVSSTTVELYVPEMYIDECIDVAKNPCWVNGSSNDSLTCNFSGFPANITVFWQRTPDDGAVLVERRFRSSGELVTTYDKERENSSFVCRVIDGSGGNSSRYAPFEQAVQIFVSGYADIPGNEEESTNKTPIIVIGVIIALMIITSIIVIIRWKRKGASRGASALKLTLDPDLSRNDIETHEEERLMVNMDPQHGPRISQGTREECSAEDRGYSKKGMKADEEEQHMVNLDPEHSGSSSQLPKAGGETTSNGQANQEPTGVEPEEMLDSQWKLKTGVALPAANAMNCMAATPDGMMAVGCIRGKCGIEIYSAEGKLQNRALNGVKVHGIAFLSDGRCVVRDEGKTKENILNVSLYTKKWKKDNARFETLSCREGRLGNLAVDSDDDIYVGYREAKKIQVFTPAGGKPVREIACDGYAPMQIFSMKLSKMIVVRDSNHSARVINGTGVKQDNLIKSIGSYVYPAVCKDDTILIATVNKERCRVTIERNTKEWKPLPTLITDHVIHKTDKRNWCYSQEFTSGEIAFCTTDRLYIFSKLATPVSV